MTYNVKMNFIASINTNDKFYSCSSFQFCKIWTHINSVFIFYQLDVSKVKFYKSIIADSYTKYLIYMYVVFLLKH